MHVYIYFYTATFIWVYIYIINMHKHFYGDTPRRTFDFGLNAIGWFCNGPHPSSPPQLQGWGSGPHVRLVLGPMHEDASWPLT